MTVQENAAAPTRRRRAELPGLPMKQRKHIFGGDIPELAAQEGRKSPGKGTIQKLTSRAGREAGRGPRIAGYIGKRPVYEPQAVLEWLDSLVTPEPRATGITVIAAPAIESAHKVATPVEPIATKKKKPIAASPTELAANESAAG
jgi:hypothetical protein